jgi:PDZ domain
VSYDTSYGEIIFLRGDINGDPVSLIFDTGARATLNSRWIQASRVPTQGAYTTSGFGPSTVSASAVPSSVWRICTEEIEIINTTVIDLVPFEEKVGRNVDGLVGSEFIHKYVIELDPGLREFRLYDPATYKPGAGASVFPLEIDKYGYGGIQAVLQFDEKRVRGLFLIDTGANGAADVFHPFAQANGLPTHLVEFREAGPAVGGNVNYRLERATDFVIGDFHLHGPVIAFADAENEWPAHQYAGLIGTDILRRFIVTFDFPHRQLYLLPLSTLSDPFAFDGGGMRLLAKGSKFETLVVSRVVKGSPAEQAGVKAGDVLVSVDGKDAGALSLDAIDRKCRKPGTLNLVLLRNGTKLKIKIKLKQLL